MHKTTEFLLPGSNKQLKLLEDELAIKNYSVLVIGSASEQIAKEIEEIAGKQVELIVEDYESLINSKLILSKNEKVNISLMDFEATDFDDELFDLVYAQASISDFRRNGIVKEIKRILKPGGYLCVGEITKLTKDIPTFVQDIFDSSDLDPLFHNDVAEYYRQKNFDIIREKDFSPSLKEYYSLSLKKLKKTQEELTDNEKSYYKKLLNKISHESKAFLKQGADKHIGFYVLLLKKN